MGNGRGFLFNCFRVRMLLTSNNTDRRVNWIARAVVLTLLAPVLIGCDTLTQLVDAQGRAVRGARRQALQRGPLPPEHQARPEDRGQALRGGRPPAPVFRLGAPLADHVGLHLLPGRHVRGIRSPPRAATSSSIPAVPDAAYAQYLIGSCYLRPDPRRHPRPGPHRARDAGVRRGGPQVSEFRIRGLRQAQDRRRRATSSPPAR